MKGLAKRLLPASVQRAFAQRVYWRELHSTGEWELNELARYVRSGSLAVDVGGNVGTYAYHLSRFAKSVISFEPNPHFADRLERLKLDRVRVERVALSDGEGEAVLRIPAVAGEEDQGMGSLQAEAVPDAALARTVSVPRRTLDSFGLRDVGFIKIDVEGHEEGVLAGAGATLARESPPLLIEIEERHNAGGLSRIRDSLGRLGYAGFFFRDGVRTPVSAFDAARDQVRPPQRPAGSHERGPTAYVNNFLFLPEPIQGAA